jgi:4-hydroxybenzoate polyprenyltransferase/phosphoserine phosphatase
LLNTYPLVVDLDGSLLHTDMLQELTLTLLRDKPLALLRIPYWLGQGKAVLKQRIAEATSFDPQTLPYNQALLTWLHQEKAQGRTLILCTASDHAVADPIAAHLQIFDAVIASDGVHNLAGKKKAEALVQRFGHAGFDYAGNARADLFVWEHARHAILVDAPRGLAEKAAACCPVTQVFPRRVQGMQTWRRVLRVHQWLKNILLCVTVFAAHQLSNPDIWFSLLFAFLSFSLCASAVYIANDLLDLESDRLHPRKRNRPFASGKVPLWQGVLLIPLLFLLSIILAFFVGDRFLAWLLFYFVLTCAYSWGLKRVILLDCITLAMLYTLRIVAGAAAAGISLSFWLLAFSVFLFLSLAFVKRYAELEIQCLHHRKKIHGRGYYTTDAPLIQTLGVTSGYAAVLLFALYLDSAQVLKLYRTPEMIWGAVPVILFWISWMWMQAHRGKMHDDPLIFALKDKASLLTGGIFIAVIAMGTVGWPW